MCKYNKNCNFCEQSYRCREREPEPKNWGDGFLDYRCCERRRECRRTFFSNSAGIYNILDSYNGHGNFLGTLTW
jgi:hypothetical protein